MIHPTADVQSHSIGEGTQIWQFCVVLPGARIGRNCNVNANCFVENDVTIGDRVTVKCGVQLWDGMTIEDDVFIGPNATFTNDRHPCSKQTFDLERTIVKRGASIGANATILPGITLGEESFIAAGAVVTKDVAAGRMVMGVPAVDVGPAPKKEE